MANTLGITEVLLDQIADSGHDINLVGPTYLRKSVYQPIVVRVTDHADNDVSETGTDTDKMAIFVSQRHMEPWKKDSGTLEHIIHGGLLPPSNVSVLFPDFDYSTTE